ncbi:hypothetical protein KIW84_063081 [Lathyrus oleraceus]|uniref:TF-B3 domain-containing protein n=1 Tax=Pisum sativum TaxID=3888 RepID=A0A9D5A6S2_PEA|nr:hypothetical protein KIW84_063081 [Pisum sativum]
MIDEIKQRVPIEFSRKYLKGFKGKAILQVGEDMAMEVIIKYMTTGSIMKSGWKKFTEKYNLQVGDVCKFVMTRDQPLLFSVTITRVRKEKKTKKFSGVSSSDNTIFKRTSIGGTSRGRPKGSKSRNVMNPKSFKVFVNCLYPNVPNEFMNGHENFVKLKMKRQSWLVKVNYYKSMKRYKFNGGWIKFSKDCKVEVGDTCLFELIDEKEMVFNVSIVGKNT